MYLKLYKHLKNIEALSVHTLDVGQCRLWKIHQLILFFYYVPE